MTNILNWLNGKKTTIGAILLLLGTLLSAVVVGIWEVDAEWIPKTIETLNWLGMTITGWGLTHKASKSMTNPV